MVLNDKQAILNTLDSPAFIRRSPEKYYDRYFGDPVPTELPPRESLKRYGRVNVLDLRRRASRRRQQPAA